MCWKVADCLQLLQDNEGELCALTPVAQDSVKNDTEDVHCEGKAVETFNVPRDKLQMRYSSVCTCVRNSTQC